MTKPNRKPTIDNPVVQIEGRAPTNDIPSKDPLDTGPLTQPDITNTGRNK